MPASDATGISAPSKMVALLPLAVVTLAVSVACSRVIVWLTGNADSQHLGPYLYNAAILVPDYFNTGFMRRGLGGTIVALMGGETGMPGFAKYHLFGAVFLGLPLALLLRRSAAQGGWRWLYLGAVLVLSPQLMLAWSIDAGKGDMLNCGFVAWSLVAALDRRFLLAALILFVGSLVHETVIFLGLGLLMPVWFLLWRTGRSTVRQGVVALAVLGVLLISSMLLQIAYGPSPSEIVRVIVQHVPPSPMRDIAAYMTAQGAGSVGPSACISFHRPAAILTLVISFAILAVYALVLQLRGHTALLVFGFAALLPLAALSIVAIDYGRWLCMAVMNAWLVAVALDLLVERVAPTIRDYAIGSAVGLALLAMGPTQIFFANSIVQRAAFRIWPPAAEDLNAYMDRCDPTWRKLTNVAPQSQGLSLSQHLHVRPSDQLATASTVIETDRQKPFLSNLTIG